MFTYFLELVLIFFTEIYTFCTYLCTWVLPLADVILKSLVEYEKKSMYSVPVLRHHSYSAFSITHSPNDTLVLFCSRSKKTVFSS